MLNKLKGQSLLLRIVLRPITQMQTNGNHSKISQFSTNNNNNNSENSEKYDIVINGGGIVGFSLLSALKSSPFLRDKRIALIERQLQPNVIPYETERQLSNRVSSLTTSSKHFLQEINVWNDLKDFAKPIKQMYVWSHRFRNGINFRANDYNNNEQLDDNNGVVCYVVENDRILSALHSKVDSLDHSVCYGTVVTDVKSDGNCVNVSTKCVKNDYMNSFKTSLLIGCDGFNSIVRQKSNLDNFEHDLEQIGIVGTIAVSTGDTNEGNDIAFQRFTPYDNGVIAVLPLTHDCCSFVWSVSKEKANQLMEMSEQQFVDHLNDTLFSETSHSMSSISNKLDEVIGSLMPKQLFSDQMPYFSAPLVLSLIPDSRAAFPLRFSTTVPFIIGSPNNSKDNNKIAIIGDAAHRVHPLAGQGLNLGLGDAKALSDCLHNQLYRGESLFNDNISDSKQLENCLFDFERQRQIKLIPMMAAIHSMQQLFHCVPSNLLTAFNSLELLKKQIVCFANNN